MPPTPPREHDLFSQPEERTAELPDTTSDAESDSDASSGASPRRNSDPQDSIPPRRIAKIALAVPLPELFDYEVPEALADEAQPGCIVRVPFGRRHLVGYLIERVDKSDHDRLKEIESVVSDGAVLSPHLLEFTQWTAHYYLAAHGEVIECALPKRIRAPKKERRVRWARLTEEKPTEAPEGTPRWKVLAALDERPEGLPVSDLLKRTGTSESPLKTLARQGAITFFQAPADPESSAVLRDPEIESSSFKPADAFDLNSDQQSAVDAVTDALEKDRFESFLLYGVTGSGKTEVYLELIERAQSMGRGALVLVPEISLTPQTVSRFERRFGRVAVLHSMLTDEQRLQHFEDLRSGRVSVAIGARSAIFAPSRDLGLIVVDESHESSYKQENSPRYHARDLAVLRSKLLSIPCILGTATPTLESLHNAQNGRYTRLDLPHRATRQSLATIELVDRRGESEATRSHMLSGRLIQAMRETLDRDEQCLLFLNRRGFARNVFCPKCGYTLRCRECDIGLTYHKREGYSLCHYCGIVEALPTRCPDCSFVGIRQRLPGTERIEEILGQLFPQVPVGRLDRDTATTGGKLEAILEDFRSGRTKILVGTQMVAKGHDIPNVTLVGVLDADIALTLPDFRAAERTCQLLCQVAGRAGRGDRPGRVYIQTRNPDHYAIEAAQAQDPTRVYDREITARKRLGYPPFGHLIRVVSEDPDDDRARTSLEAVAKALRSAAPPSVRLLGPAPAPLARLRGRYRYHLLLKGKDRAELHPLVAPVAFLRPAHSTSRITVDVDPQSLM